MTTWERFHVWGRSKLCPFKALASFVPKQGKIIDVGCGHGLFSKYLKQESSARDIRGLDVDKKKIAFARANFSRDGLVFEDRDLLVHDIDCEADCIVIVDVLYLIPYARQREIIRRCRELLRENGMLLIKEIDNTPSWKASFNRFEETLAVKILRITHGKEFYFHHAEDFRKVLVEEGFSVNVHALDRGYPHSHVAFVCRKQLGKYDLLTSWT